jgi:hypothetical protein
MSPGKVISPVVDVYKLNRFLGFPLLATSHYPSLIGPGTFFGASKAAVVQ